jgi:hypothetical protein
LVSAEDPYDINLGFLNRPNFPTNVICSLYRHLKESYKKTRTKTKPKNEYKMRISGKNKNLLPWKILLVYVGANLDSFGAGIIF